MSEIQIYKNKFQRIFETIRLGIWLGDFQFFSSKQASSSKQHPTINDIYDTFFLFFHCFVPTLLSCFNAVASINNKLGKFTLNRLAIIMCASE